MEIIAAPLSCPLRAQNRRGEEEEGHEEEAKEEEAVYLAVDWLTVHF